MSRYIDADKFVEWLDVGHLRSPSEICYCEGDVKTMIDIQPTADVVEVVRCKDCKNAFVGRNGRLICDLIYPTWDWVEPTDYCCHGERSENGKS